MNREIISALAGLAGACQSGEKTADTDSVFTSALSRCFSDLSGEEATRIAEGVREEKFRVSPNCRTCQHPCGNTSDFNFEEFEAAADNRALRLEMITKAVRLAGKNGADPKTLPLLYKAVSYFSYDLDPSAYPPVITELDKALQ